MKEHKNHETKPIISKKEAASKGLKQYYTGLPCVKGHIDSRHVSSGGCMECSRIRSLKRMRENPEARKRSRESQKLRYRMDEEYREKVKLRSIEWHYQNQERASESKKRWYLENKEHAKIENARRLDEYRNDPEWVERERARKRLEMKNHPHRRAASYGARRAREENVEGKFSPNDVLSLLDQQNYQCVYCKTCLKEYYEVDHITPISRGGSNWPSNLQCLCRSCNRRKSSKDPIEFEKEMGLFQK